ncbi:hypothetical protein ACT691_13570 [Vibrio metschnikovii]
MSNLLPGKYHVELSSELTEEEKVATFASDMANNINNREVFDIVHADQRTCDGEYRCVACVYYFLDM